MRERRHLLRILLATSIVLGGCGAIIGTRDLEYDPTVGPGNDSGASDGTTNIDGTTSTDGSVDGGGEGGPCVADLTNDPKNCGRCGHDCGASVCTASKCQPAELGNVADAPLNHIIASGDFVFVATRITLTTQAGGIWRVPKKGGTPVKFADARYAQGMVVLADKLYFVVNDYVHNGVDQFGGLWSCPLAATPPCTPTLVKAAESPSGITIDNGKIYYGDSDGANGLMEYVPPAAPTIYRLGFGSFQNYYVDGPKAFYSVSFFNSPQRATLFEIYPDAGDVTELYRFEVSTADDGRLVGTKDALFFSAYQYNGAATGVMRRVPRAGGTPCNYGGTTNKRPYGIHIDSARIYWANQGEGNDQPYTGGSVVSCDVAGCCPTPDVHWTGNGQPTAVTGDDKAIYFTTYANGSVWTVAKP